MVGFLVTRATPEPHAPVMWPHAPLCFVESATNDGTVEECPTNI